MLVMHVFSEFTKSPLNEVISIVWVQRIILLSIMRLLRVQDVIPRVFDYSA